MLGFIITIFKIEDIQNINLGLGGSVFAEVNDRLGGIGTLTRP